MPPLPDTALDRFERDNVSLVHATRALLARIVTDAVLHGRLLNTLSMLEHLGSRKIVATQHSPVIDQATLKHVAEEAQHAYFMKRQAEKTAGKTLDYDHRDLLAPATARMYFQRLEAALARRLEGRGSDRATYLYMSMIIELRALWFYRIYQQCLKGAGHALSLKRVLGEEEHHLNEVAQRLETAGELSETLTKDFLSVEQRLYRRLLDALRQAVPTAPPLLSMSESSESA